MPSLCVLHDTGKATVFIGVEEAKEWLSTAEHCELMWNAEGFSYDYTKSTINGYRFEGTFDYRARVRRWLDSSDVAGHIKTRKKNE